MESRRRSIAKALSWRVVAMLITAMVALLWTGEWELAAAIGLADTVIKLGLYYLHERLWVRIDLGKPKPPEYEI